MERVEEWLELLVGLASGGLGGTILGRVWDNRREDRFRHVEFKREIVAGFLKLLTEYKVVSRRRSLVMRDVADLGPQPEDKPRGALRDWQVRSQYLAQEGSDIAERREELLALLLIQNEQIRLLYSVSVAEAATSYMQVVLNDEDDPPVEDSLRTKADSFLPLVRVELGVPGPGRFKRMWHRIDPPV